MVGSAAIRWHARWLQTQLRTSPLRHYLGLSWVQISRRPMMFPRTQVLRSTLAFFGEHLGASAAERYPRPAIDERRLASLEKMITPSGACATQTPSMAPKTLLRGCNLGVL